MRVTRKKMKMVTKKQNKDKEHRMEKKQRKTMIDCMNERVVVLMAGGGDNVVFESDVKIVTTVGVGKRTGKEKI